MGLYARFNASKNRCLGLGGKRHAGWNCHVNVRLRLHLEKVKVIETQLLEYSTNMGSPPRRGKWRPYARTLSQAGMESMNAKPNSSTPIDGTSSPSLVMALSIRQPFAELILRGMKTIEYRSLRTNRRERVYIYASKIPGDDAASWAQVEREPGQLPTGFLVGTVEIIGCDGQPGNFHWQLAKAEAPGKAYQADANAAAHVLQAILTKLGTQVIRPIATTIMTRMTLPVVLGQLQAHYGKQKPPKLNGPWEMILWENVAYLAADDRRLKAFQTLVKRIGTEPMQILSASDEALLEVTQHGIMPELFAQKLRKCAKLLLEELDGDLRPILQWPLPKAKRALQKFPGIGEPGAEKILVFCRAYPLLALESNGLRVLLRLGFGEEKKSYSATYRLVQQAAGEGFVKDCGALIEAQLLLRHHGQELCRAHQAFVWPVPISRRLRVPCTSCHGEIDAISFRPPDRSQRLIRSIHRQVRKRRQKPRHKSKEPLAAIPNKIAIRRSAERVLPRLLYQQ